MSKKIKYIIYFLLALIVFTPVVGHYIAKSSEPYTIATTFINDNAVVKKEIGDIQSQKLKFFGYSVKYKGTTGKASFNIAIIGITGLSGDIAIELIKEAGGWQVTNANLIKIDGSSTIIK